MAKARPFRSEATYAPVSNRAGERSALGKIFALSPKSGRIKLYQLIR